MCVHPAPVGADSDIDPSEPLEEGEAVILSDVSEEEMRRIAADVNRNGFAEVERFVISGHAAMRKFVLDAVEANGGEYTCLTGADALAPTPFGTVARDEKFIKLVKRVHEIGFGRPGPEQSFYQVLRCLKGASGLPHSLKFHYDSYAVTALLPVFIPTTGNTGDLLLVKRRRAIRRHYIRNLVDKVFLDNPVTQRFLRHRHKTNSAALMRLKLVPGNLYLFWGYQTVHANDRCDTDQLRATALYHYNNPHAENFLRHYTGRERKA